MLGSVRCAACGNDSPAGFRFCGACGAALEEAPAAGEVRKLVTILFADLAGSTDLAMSRPRGLRDAMRATTTRCARSSRPGRHRREVHRRRRDGGLRRPGLPRGRPLRAVRAAWEMRAAVPALGLRARIGVNTGEVMAGEEIRS